MRIQARAPLWHLAVARQHIEQSDHRRDGGIDGTQQQQAHDQADEQTENVAPMFAKRQRAIMFAKKPQHILVALLDGISRNVCERKHRPAQQSGAENYFDCDGPDGLPCG